MSYLHVRLKSGRYINGDDFKEGEDVITEDEVRDMLSEGAALTLKTLGGWTALRVENIDYIKLIEDTD